MKLGGAALAVAGLVGGARAFAAAGTDNLVLYWGQNSAGSQTSLASYCTDSTTDVFILSFLTSFGTGAYDVNFANACEGTYVAGSTLLRCDTIARDIKTCQAAGKKILLSMGGASGNYGFTSAAQAQQVADDLWNYFGGGSSSIRPFGDSVVDGFDLDIENGNPAYYPEFITRMRSNYATQTARQYYIAGAPQCPYPDASLKDALAGSWFDFLFIQFYNNYCGVNQWGSSNGWFNYNTWDQWARTQSVNPNVRLYLGVAGAVSAANAGSYVGPDVLVNAAQTLKQRYPGTFGGVMMWDASQAYANVPSGYNGLNYAQIAKKALGGSITAATVGTTSTTSTPVAAPATTTPAPTTTAATSATRAVFQTPAAPAASAPVNTCGAPTYVVQSGDYCNLVLSKNGNKLTLDQFYAANPQVDSACSNLQLGGTVIVGPCPSNAQTQTAQAPAQTTTTAAQTTAATPAATTATTATTTGCTYSVQSGDYCNLILSKTGNQISLAQFYALNPAVNAACSNLQVGQSVVVGQGSACAAAASSAAAAAAQTPSSPTTGNSGTGTTGSAASTSLAGTCPVAGAACADGAYQCAGYGYAQCVFGKWVMRNCGAGTACAGSGASIYCDWVPSGSSVTCDGIAGAVHTKRELLPFEDAFLHHDGVPSALREEAEAHWLEEEEPEIVTSVKTHRIDDERFVVVLKARAVGVAPIAKDWYFQIDSDRQLTHASRGLLAHDADLGAWTVSADRELEDRPLRTLVVKIYGQYRPQRTAPVRQKSWFW